MLWREEQIFTQLNSGRPQGSLTARSAGVTATPPA